MMLSAARCGSFSEDPSQPKGVRVEVNAKLGRGNLFFGGLATKIWIDWVSRLCSLFLNIYIKLLDLEQLNGTPFSKVGPPLR